MHFLGLHLKLALEQGSLPARSAADAEFALCVDGTVSPLALLFPPSRVSTDLRRELLKRVRNFDLPSEALGNSVYSGDQRASPHVLQALSRGVRDCRPGVQAVEVLADGNCVPASSVQIKKEGKISRKKTRIERREEIIK